MCQFGAGRRWWPRRRGLGVDPRSQRVVQTLGSVLIVTEDTARIRNQSVSCVFINFIADLRQAAFLVNGPMSSSLGCEGVPVPKSFFFFLFFKVLSRCWIEHFRTKVWVQTSLYIMNMIYRTNQFCYNDIKTPKSTKDLEAEWSIKIDQSQLYHKVNGDEKADISQTEKEIGAGWWWMGWNCQWRRRCIWIMTEDWHYTVTTDSVTGRTVMKQQSVPFSVFGNFNVLNLKCNGKNISHNTFTIQWLSWFSGCQIRSMQTPVLCGMVDNSILWAV